MYIRPHLNKDQIVADYIGGLSLSQVAAKHSTEEWRCHERVIHNIIRSRAPDVMRAQGVQYPHQGKWNPRRIERLIELRDQKLSALAIAAKLGTTRNSVIGKLHRMGLRLDSQAPSYLGERIYPMARAKRGPHGRPPPVTRSQSQQCVQNEFIGRIRKGERLQKEKPPALIAEAIELPFAPILEPMVWVSLFDLAPDDCRWVMGEPKDMAFCGGRVASGCEYCGFHKAMAYRPRQTPVYA